MESIFKEIAVNPSSVNISDVETVYSDDSLCIIHCNFSAKDNFGVDIKNNCEYIFINSNGKNYESYNMIDKGDKVFVTPDEYENNKKGTIYETLPYNAGLRYLAAISVTVEEEKPGIRMEMMLTYPSRQVLALGNLWHSRMNLEKRVRINIYCWLAMVYLVTQQPQTQK